MGSSGPRRNGSSKGASKGASKGQKRPASVAPARQRALTTGQGANGVANGNGHSNDHTPATIASAPRGERMPTPAAQAPISPPSAPAHQRATRTPPSALPGDERQRDTRRARADTPVTLLDTIEERPVATRDLPFAPDDAPGYAPDEDDDADIVERTPLARVSAPRFDAARLGPMARAWAASATSRARGRIRDLTPEQWLWIGVVFLAAVLRFWGLGDKPLHHDESMHAYYSLIFAHDPSSYAYNPLLHGPFQFHAEGIMMALIMAVQHLFGAGGGAAGNPWINDTTARFVPALFGIGIVALPYGLRRELGRAGALIAAFLLAVSPAFVYFSRFLREDIYFNFFMFAMVVCAAQFARKRTTGWFVGLFLSAVLAYATFEGFFLTAAIFVGFLVILAAWELANGLARKLPQNLNVRERAFFSRTLTLLALATVGGTAAVIGLRKLADLSAYVNNPKTKPLADAQVQWLEATSVAVLLYASIVIALIVITVLIWQLGHDTPAMTYASAYTSGGLTAGQAADDLDDDIAPQPPTTLTARIERYALAPTRGILWLRAKLQASDQPFLLLLLSINWVQWFVAFVLSWILFAALYWIIPGPTQGAMTLGQGFSKGVGSGLWDGLYYWLQQQEVARGGQPLYYYLLLIPLYEQLAVVFGLAGLVYALRRPTRFRLFLVWWFIASLGLYSWAGEKMPWLSIHILLSLFLLAGLALNWIAHQCVAYAPSLFAGPLNGRAGGLALAGAGNGTSGTAPTGLRAFFARTLRSTRRHFAEDTAGEAPAPDPAAIPSSTRTSAQRRARRRGIAGLVGAVGAFLLLVPMVHSMWILSHQDAANGPLEMMVYVQTTDDVDLSMNKINAADQKLYGGQHKLRIAVGTGEEWPYYWYLRDYTQVTWEYNSSTPGEPQEDVLILLPSDAQVFMAAHPTGYHEKQYKLRSWFDESYKPLPCTPTKGHPCSAAANWGYGVGLGNYLSYGPTPPAQATFNPAKAAGRLWSWLWVRQPLGDTNGSYDFTLIVRDGLPIQP